MPNGIYMRSHFDVLIGATILMCVACGPQLPPTTVPKAADPALTSFEKALQVYVDEIGRAHV